MVCYAIVNISPSLTNILNVDQIKTQVANPDFMAVLAPQWPEPDPDPTEDQAFLQQQRLPSSRRGSKELMNAPSWSSLFNVASEADIASEENYRDSLYRGRYRKE